jgi:hypothetical protein
MQKLCAALLFLALGTLNGSSDTVKPTPDLQHKATHHIEMETPVQGDSCSATAVGPHALLTAGHCLLANDEISVDGQLAHIQNVLFDHADHIILRVDLTFTNYVSLDERAPKPQEVVHLWGNPGHSRDIFRIGYYEADMAGLHIYVLPIYPGDSGAGVFSEDGKIIDVISLGNESAEAACYPLTFTPDQLASIQH